MISAARTVYGDVISDLLSRSCMLGVTFRLWSHGERSLKGLVGTGG